MQNVNQLHFTYQTRSVLGGKNIRSIFYRNNSAKLCPNEQKMQLTCKTHLTESINSVCFLFLFISSLSTSPSPTSIHLKGENPGLDVFSTLLTAFIRMKFIIIVCFSFTLYTVLPYHFTLSLLHHIEFKNNMTH